jgi:hypothetical protein
VRFGQGAWARAAVRASRTPGKAGEKRPTHGRERRLRGRSRRRVTRDVRSLCLAEPEMLEQGERQQRQQGVVVEPGPGATLEMIEPQFHLEFADALAHRPNALSGPRPASLAASRRDGWSDGTCARRWGAAPRPTQTASPGACWPRAFGGPSATRTRTAASGRSAAPWSPSPAHLPPRVRGSASSSVSADVREAVVTGCTGGRPRGWAYGAETVASGG